MRKIALPVYTHVIPAEKFKGTPKDQIPSEEDRTETWDYADAIEAIILRSDQPEPLSYRELKHCNAINAALESAQANGDGIKVMLIEEADYEFLKNRVEAFPFRRWSRFLVPFMDDIRNAPQVEAKSGE